MQSQKGTRILIITVVSASLLLVSVDNVSAHHTPKLENPDKFEIQLCADLAEFGRLKVFQLTFTNGENGFPAGLYVTSGPSGDDRSDRLIRVDQCMNKGSTQKVNIVRDGFVSNEALVFAKGPYGDGMLISAPLKQQILRLSPNGTLTNFTSVGTEPFGPVGIDFGPDPLGEFPEVLFAVDFDGDRILRVDPEGNSTVFTECPSDLCGGGSSGGGGASGKWFMFDPTGRYSNGFIFSTYSFGVRDAGAILAISPDGKNFTLIAGQDLNGGKASAFSPTSDLSLDGVEILAFGPGGSFGSDLYVPTIGYDGLHGEGNLLIMSPDGRLTPFITNMDATSVVFDSNGILGGGMFIADFNEELGAGKIWRVTPAAGEEWNTFSLKIGDKSYQVRYQITGGTLKNMSADPETATLTVAISSTSDGSLKIELPRTIIDSRTSKGSDADFAAFIDDAEFTVPSENLTTADIRTLSIDFPAGTETISILGTSRFH